MQKFRIPEILLGVFLTIGALSIGATIPGIYPKNQNYETNANNRTTQISAKDITDERIADYTEALAWFTAIMALATIALFGVTWRASTRQSADMQEMRDIAEKQMNISALQTDIQKKQHAVGRLQFLAAHRPRLRVRHVTIRDGSHIGHPTIFFTHGGAVTGSLILVNAGGTNATIIDARYRIYFSKSGLPAGAAPYEDESQTLLPSGEILQVGQSCATSIEDTIVMDPSDHDIRAFERRGWKIYVMGYVRYRDEADVERFMGFCRLRGDDGRFRAVDDPDYEYED